MTKTHGTGAERTATEMLTQDHKRVQKLFKDFDKVDRDDVEAVRELVETACLELQIHSLLEEEIFYPAIRMQAPDFDELLNKSEVEHETVDDLIAKLHDLEADDPMYTAYFSVLCELVKLHMREEEQKLFPRTQDMAGLDLKKLGEDMRLRREELFAEMERGEEEASAELPEGVEDDTVAGDDGEELEDEQEQIDISRTRH